MTSVDLKKKIKDAQKQIEKLQGKLVEYSEKLFKTTCVEIFKKHKDFNSFAWTQFTAYWNDGDPCEFCAHTDSIYIDGEDDEEYFSSLESLYQDLKNKDKSISKLEKEIDKLEKQNKKDNEWQIKSHKSRIEQLNKLDLETTEKRYLFLEDINDLLENMDQNALEKMFGDHAKVVVTRNGIEVESYEHD